jgi:hypothetical protein
MKSAIIIISVLVLFIILLAINPYSIREEVFNNKLPAKKEMPDCTYTLPPDAGFEQQAGSNLYWIIWIDTQAVAGRAGNGIINVYHLSEALDSVGRHVRYYLYFAITKHPQGGSTRILYFADTCLAKGYYKAWKAQKTTNQKVK